MAVVEICNHFSQVFHYLFIKFSKGFQLEQLQSVPPHCGSLDGSVIEHENVVIGINLAKAANTVK